MGDLNRKSEWFFSSLLKGIFIAFLRAEMKKARS
jgi:hypothetical protein